MTAEALIARIKARGGRVYRMRSLRVFCLTDDPELRDGLIKLGGSFFASAGYEHGPEGGYRRSRNAKKLEYDIWIHTIPVEGETTIWEEAGREL